jgi:hypothetical protein
MRKWLDLNKALFPLYSDKINKEIQAPDGEGSSKTDTTWL